MKRVIQVLKDPLVHFLLAGFILFIIFNIVSPKGTSINPKMVVVDRDVLLTFIQNRSKVFELKIAESKLNAMDENQRKTLIDDYIREEVLYREALALGLNNNDYVVRRRLIQGIEFITEGVIEKNIKIDDSLLEEYFNQNKDAYYVEPFVTLTHVFFDVKKHSEKEIIKLIAQKKEELNKSKTVFSDAVKHGDRFLYHVNYVERTYDFIQSHFGNEMAGQIFSLKPSQIDWYGPFESAYGSHLVMLTKKQEGRYPSFSEIKDRLETDYLYSQKKIKQDEAIKRIIDSYEVEIKL